MKKILNLYVTDKNYENREYSKDERLESIPVVTDLIYEEIHIVGGEPLSKYGRVYNMLTNINELLPELYGFKPNIYIHTGLWRPAVLITMTEVCDVLIISLTNKEDLITFKQMNKDLMTEFSDIYYHFRGVKVIVETSLDIGGIDISPLWTVRQFSDKVEKKADSRRLAKYF